MLHRKAQAGDTYKASRTFHHRCQMKSPNLVMLTPDHLPEVRLLLESSPLVRGTKGHTQTAALAR